ncbi:hypothetical protein, partial [Raoultella ornithinolytica]|uniref:hypothetical protein n=1 Tax=Raoultella ornithinolytica TaxID=54291 RepID=UPI0019548AFE
LQAQTAHDGAPQAMSQSMLYTSGTTGRPKGVRRLVPSPEQRQLMAETRRTVYGVTPEARILLPGPLCHGAPNGIAL